MAAPGTGVSGSPYHKSMPSFSKRMSTSFSDWRVVRVFCSLLQRFSRRGIVHDQSELLADFEPRFAFRIIRYALHIGVHRNGEIDRVPSEREDHASLALCRFAV